MILIPKEGGGFRRISETQARNWTAPDGSGPYDLHDHERQAQFDVVELSEPARPSAATHNVRDLFEAETVDGPWFEAEAKPQAELDATFNSGKLAEIAALEAQFLLPRVTREFMLTAFAAQATSAGVDPMTNVAYAKVKSFDAQINALRGELRRDSGGNIIGQQQ